MSGDGTSGLRAIAAPGTFMRRRPVPVQVNRPLMALVAVAQAGLHHQDTPAALS